MDQIDQIIPKLCAACNGLRSMVHFSNNDILNNLLYLFSPYKKIVIIMVDAKPKSSPTGLLRRLESLLVPCKYIFPLTTSVKKIFQANSAVLMLT
jgi:hypothetical protein